MERLTAEEILAYCDAPKHLDRKWTIYDGDLALEIIRLKERVKALEEKKLPCSVCGGMHEAITHVQV